MFWVARGGRMGSVERWNLARLRSNLGSFGFDWNSRPLAAPAERSSHVPIRVEIDHGVYDGKHAGAPPALIRLDNLLPLIVQDAD